MKKISCWASTHVNTAVSAIICIKILLIILACYTGLTLYKLQIVLPVGIIYPIALSALLVLLVIYPSRKKTFYVRQKVCDVILPLLSFVVIMSTVNTADKVTFYSEARGSSIIKKQTAEEILASGKTGSSLSRKEKKILKKEFYHQLKVFATAKMADDKEGADKALKIILAIIGALGLIFLLGCLVCGLSCGGSDAAALIVAILGLTGIIWGFVAMVKRINRGKKLNANKEQ